ncbi:MAG: pyruvate dehydrogenase complex dihydrolipoamide acetyltransferase [Verrucomicrobiota bacterium]
MAKEITMPLLSPSMTEGTVAKWLKKEGDTVKSGEVIAEVETDKATMELEAFDSGTIRKLLVEEGTAVPINARIGVIGSPDEDIPEEWLKANLEEAKAPEPEKAEKPAAKAEPANGSTPAPAPAPAPVAAPAPVPAPVAVAAPPELVNGGRVKASPLAKKLARERGYNLGLIPGSGPGGRVTKRDVLGFKGNGSGGASLLPKGPVAEPGRQPASGMRKVIAQRLLQSKTTIPHFYLQVEVDAAPLMSTRAALNEELAQMDPPRKLTVNDFVLKAVVQATHKVPHINAAWDGDAIVQYGDVDLAVAVSVEAGLLTPIVRSANQKSIVAISNEVKDLSKRAKEGSLKPEEFQGGTITVSNMGMYGIESFYAIINPPQASIVAVGGIVKKPVVDASDNIVVGHRMMIGLSGDHRVVDGSAGAAYLAEVRRLLEAPALLLI